MNNRPPTTDDQPDGILVIDKPADWTSHDVVAKVRKICRTRRVGHTGTLDPFATGVLVVCLNRATRLVQFLTGADKEYLATIHFGFATDTGDLTGTSLTPPAATAHLTDALLADALQQFRGRSTQIPPMYSAKKIGGVKLYEMARRGETIERQPISITISALEIIAPLQLDECVVRVVCSAGTYIRTLAEDIGKAVGVGAHLTTLRRTRVGNCNLGQAHTLEALAAIAEAGVALGGWVSGKPGKRQARDAGSENRENNGPAPLQGPGEHTVERRHEPVQYSELFHVNERGDPVPP